MLKIKGLVCFICRGRVGGRDLFFLFFEIWSIFDFVAEYGWVRDKKFLLELDVRRLDGD